MNIHKKYDGNRNGQYIELYEEFENNSKEKLNKREGEIQREITTINKTFLEEQNRILP